jgi:lipopolysaccharide export system protein LptA
MSPPRLLAVAVALALAAAAAPRPAAAQGFAMSKAGEQQIQVFADNGIEWHAEDLRVIASGNARALRGTMSVDADMLTAHYRQGAKGDEIWRLDADGKVSIRSTTDTATGTKAIYDLDKAVFVLKGAPARLVTPTDQFQATESLEYWEGKKMAVLRGDAVATRADRTLRADVITAHFHDKGDKAARTKNAGGGAKGGDDGLDLQRADAYGHVRLTTATETVTGDRGDYDAETGIATVTGAVKIVREGGNQLEGGWAYVNLKTGISKLFPAPPGANGAPQRVQGVFSPQKRAESNRTGFSGHVPSSEDFGTR